MLTCYLCRPEHVYNFVTREQSTGVSMECWSEGLPIPAEHGFEFLEMLLACVIIVQLLKLHAFMTLIFISLYVPPSVLSCTYRISVSPSRLPLVDSIFIVFHRFPVILFLFHYLNFPLCLFVFNGQPLRSILLVYSSNVVVCHWLHLPQMPSLVAVIILFRP